MIVTFIILWLLTFLMLAFDWKTVSSRWAAMITFCGGCGGFARAWLETFLPYLNEVGLAPIWLESLSIIIYDAGSFINTNGLPISFLLFAFSYSKALPPKASRYCAWLAFIPFPAMLIVTPFDPVRHDYGLHLFWVGPYILGGAYLLLKVYINETSASMKHKHLTILLLAVPPVMFQLVSNYILRAFEIHEAWRLNVISITVLLLIYAVYLYKHGLFGLRLRLERERIASSLQALSSGSVFLQHTLKSETAKIRMLADQLLHVAMDRRLDEVMKPTQHIQSSADHLIQMMERLHHQAQEIVLLEKEIALSELIEQCLQSLHPHLSSRAITVKKSLRPDVILICDPVHMKETLHNLMMNAIEASSDQSDIELTTSETTQGFILSIRDYGTGIDKEHLDLIFDPFFTTKSLKTNYGLGLTFSRKVVDAHGGDLSITSCAGGGSTVQIHWSAKKMLLYKMEKEKSAYESHKGFAG